MLIKTIFILWFQGFGVSEERLKSVVESTLSKEILPEYRRYNGQSPDVVNRCVYSWEKYNPNWNIILIDNHNLRDFLLLEEYIDLSKTQISLQEKSNIIRCILLNKYGGVWADATTFCNKPLDNWLPEYAKEGFFAFNKPSNDWLPDYINDGKMELPLPERLVSNWFIYSEPNHYIINRWMVKTIEFHKSHETEDYSYFIHHFLFGELYYSDSVFKVMWDKVPKFDANGVGPHYLDEKGFFSELSDETKRDIDDRITPLYKLTHKVKFPEYDETLNLYYLYSINLRG